MKRIVISLLVGSALTLAVPSVAALVLNRADTNAILPLLLYWPLVVTDKLGLGDCGNANLIADKVTCMHRGLLIDTIAYPLVVFVCSYMIHRSLFRNREPLRPAQVR